MRGYANDGVAEKVRAAGGEIFAVTSEPQSLATRAEREWGFGFAAVGDPHHEISGGIRERGWLDLFVNERLDFLQQSAVGNDWAVAHPKGYYQPGVLAVDDAGRILYRWRGVPTHQNMGGATERPTGAHVWKLVEEALASEGPDAPLDDDPPLDSRAIPWPLFASLLVANGWFLRPRGFPHLERGPSPQQRVLRAGLRLLAFVAAWLAAFVLLPKLGVAAALAAWIAWITPKVRFVNREFQHVRRRGGSGR